MKYWPGVPTCAPNGLRTHICHVPSAAATAKAAKATHKCARQKRSVLRTSRPPIRARFKLVLRNYLNDTVHFAVPQPAIFVTRHEEIARPREHRMHLGDISRHDHGVHVRAGDQDAVDNVGACHPKGYSPPLGHLNAPGNEHELRRDDTCSDTAVGGDCGTEVLFRKFARKVKGL